MQEITIGQAREKASSWQEQRKAWHFHVLFPNCIFNTRKDRYAMVLENRMDGETYVIYSDDGFAKFSQELLKMNYGNDILKAHAGGTAQEKPDNPLFAHIKRFKQNKIPWHHHMLFPDCILNDHPGKWNIVLEGSGEPQVYNALYDEDPLDDLSRIEIEYFKEIDPTFEVEIQEEKSP